ncbi:MAG: hypothetical protein GY724_00195 [Actinomycetia bacterium]|nr:hypothetical protein [Actinomycetes bacterium]MCP4227789.1 hypothetical protein [Actinomycetes bacterium]MCP5030446.1 hypothetical protein [Actinomycetes bacterium]
MGIGRLVGGAVAGLGLVGVGYAGLGGEDNTTRDDAGSIVEEGELGAFRIRVGDCIGGALGDEVESVDGVPCDGPHEFEVYYAFNLPEGDGNYPGDYSVEEAASDGCYEAFEPFVGVVYEASIYGFNTLTPTEGSWDGLDDREVLCMLGNYDGTLKTGTARGSAT